MDQFLLHAVVEEAARRLVEHEVHDVVSAGRSRYVIRFATASRDNLLVSARPDLPRFHLVRGERLEEGPPDPFGAQLDRELAGSVLVALVKRPWDRIVEMTFRLPRRDDGETERRLVAELLGRSANLLLLDGSLGIVAAARPWRGAGPSAADRPAPYTPPGGREDLTSVPCSPDALPALWTTFGGVVPLLERVSPLLAADLKSAAADPARAEARLASILTACRDGAWSPTVYAAQPLAGGRVEAPDRPAEVVIAPLPLLAPPAGLVATPFDSPSAAAQAGLGLLERARDIRDALEHHRSLARRETARLESLCRKLEAERAAALASDAYRRLGEALLAGLASARVRGGEASVPDPYDPEGPPVTVPIDPRLPLAENARRLFDRYKKGKRGLVAVEARLQAARKRLDEWRDLAGRAEAARTPDDVEALREGMARLGLVHAPRSRGRSSRRAETPPARVRSYVTPDGWTILVGKSGEENDTLTFRVASPWDFWFHAADRPGAHVVLRNPRRLKTVSERSLRVAAEIAAWHSGARQERHADVHYTQRKHVHKKKGMPAGQVHVKRFRTMQVTPRLPGSPLEEV